MITIKGDITDITYGFVCHQVNCQGVMGAGVAMAIRKKWPVAYTQYRKAYINGQLKLGNAIFIHVTEFIYVVHMCGQNGYGRHGVFTDYTALEKAIESVKNVRIRRHKTGYSLWPIYFPKGIGCGLAGGDWKVVSKIIEKYISDAILVNYEK